MLLYVIDTICKSLYFGLIFNQLWVLHPYLFNKVDFFHWCCFSGMWSLFCHCWSQTRFFLLYKNCTISYKIFSLTLNLFLTWNAPNNNNQYEYSTTNLIQFMFWKVNRIGKSSTHIISGQVLWISYDKNKLAGFIFACRGYNLLFSVTL